VGVIGNAGAVRGAVVGAVTRLGSRLGKADTMEEGLRRLVVAQELGRRLRVEVQMLSCPGLTGANLTSEEGRQI
jgi:hypothetical protein